jgi:hypothetical protein
VPGRALGALAALLLLGPTAASPADGFEGRAGLAEAARAYRQVLQEEQDAVRGSELASPRGVEQVVQFDLASHACHRGPGQAYRAYEEPAVRQGDAGEAVAVRYPFRVFYRKALTLDELFRSGWEEGTPGALEVRFEPEPREEGEAPRWVPISRREVLPQLEGGSRGAGR